MSDDASRVDELVAKDKEIRDHPASRAHRRITNLKRVFDVWQEFTASLDTVRARCEGDESVIIALMRQTEDVLARERVERELDKSLLA